MSSRDCETHVFFSAGKVERVLILFGIKRTCRLALGSLRMRLLVGLTSVYLLASYLAVGQLDSVIKFLPICDSSCRHDSVPALLYIFPHFLFCSNFAQPVFPKRTGSVGERVFFGVNGLRKIENRARGRAFGQALLGTSEKDELLRTQLHHFTLQQSKRVSSACLPCGQALRFLSYACPNALHGSDA